MIRVARGTARAACLALLAATLARAQKDNEHGVSASQTRTAYLVKPVPVSLPDPPLDASNPNSVYTRRIELENQAIGQAGGAPVQLTIAGRTTLLPPGKPIPRLVFETWSEHLGHDYQESVFTDFSSVTWDANRTTIQRFVKDDLRRVYIHYSVAVEKLPEGYRATFAAPSAPAPQDIAASPDWKVVIPARLPEPQMLQDGDILALELYTVPRTGQSLVDYVHFADLAPVQLRKQAARDSYADDAELAAAQPRLRLNGLPIPSAAEITAPHAPVLSLFVPGQGSFLLSLQQRPGFELAGEVSGNSLTFSSAGNVFRLDCAVRIASAGSAIYNIYVRPVPSAPAPQDPSRFFLTPELTPALP